MQRRLGMALLVPLLAGSCADDVTAATHAPDSGAPSRVFFRWLGAVEDSDVRVAVLVGAKKVRLFFCGDESYATTTRWFDVAPDGEHVEFQDDTWRLHAHLRPEGLFGEIERAGDVARSFNAAAFDPASLAGLYEGTADCGRLGLIVTQATPRDAATARGACTGATAQQIHAVEPISLEDGKIRVRAPGNAAETALLQPAVLEPL